jgi:two-component system response regulator HydG
MTTRVLVVDDDPSTGDLVSAALSQRGMSVEWKAGADGAITALRDSDFDVVIADINLDGMSGLDLCAWASTNRPNVPVIMITAYGNMQAAVSAVRSGAHDFINKPFEVEALAASVASACQQRRLETEVRRIRNDGPQAYPVEGLVGESAAMQDLYDLIARVAPTDTSVLITGESGTGKELVARALHARSERKDGPFVALNCAAVPSNLLESELFGHVRGAFTDAKETRRGLFSEGGGRTVFLDEVGEMAVDMQLKLLRVLQERKVRPVGANAEVSFDARLIAATNLNLEDAVERGTFREDLYYRLNVVQLHVPPLRDRGNDVLLLAQHFVERYAQRIAKPVGGISPEAAGRLLDYDWPGNVRQLENTIERAVTLTRFDQLMVDDLPDNVQKHHAVDPIGRNRDLTSMPTLSELERNHIGRVLSAAGGNKTQAAKILGLDRRTLYRKLDRFSRHPS